MQLTDLTDRIQAANDRLAQAEAVAQAQAEQADALAKLESIEQLTSIITKAMPAFFVTYPPLLEGWEIVGHKNGAIAGFYLNDDFQEKQLCYFQIENSCKSELVLRHTSTNEFKSAALRTSAQMHNLYQTNGLNWEDTFLLFLEKWSKKMKDYEVKRRSQLERQEQSRQERERLDREFAALQQSKHDRLVDLRQRVQFQHESIMGVIDRTIERTQLINVFQWEWVKGGYSDGDGYEVFDRHSILSASSEMIDGWMVDLKGDKWRTEAPVTCRTLTITLNDFALNYDLVIDRSITLQHVALVDNHYVIAQGSSCDYRYKAFISQLDDRYFPATIDFSHLIHELTDIDLKNYQALIDELEIHF